MAQKISQSKQILAYLQAGNTLTQLEAADLFNCWRLGARIKDLRDAGHAIHTLMETNEQTGKTYARYVMQEVRHA